MTYLLSGLADLQSFVESIKNFFTTFGALISKLTWFPFTTPIVAFFGVLGVLVLYKLVRG